MDVSKLIATRKVISTYVIHLSSSFIINTTMGIEIRNNQKVFVPRDFRLSTLCKGVQLYPHGRIGLTTIPCAQDKGCLTSSNLSLIWPECHMKGLTGSWLMLPPSNRHHLVASFMDKPVAISYSACQPHPQHVICIGGGLMYPNIQSLTAPCAMPLEIPHSQ